jgi:MoaA/NifB/PqqE/SkfB family radical SAM enzyme
MQPAAARRPECRRGVVYVTRACNLKCLFCYYLYEEEKTHVPRDSIERTLERFQKDYRLEAVDLTGGEPTVHPDIIQIVRSANRYRLKPTLITNAQRPDRLANCIQAGLDDLLISVHALEERYDQLVQRTGAFKNVERTVEMLHHHRFAFRTNTTLTRESCLEIESIARWLLRASPRIVNLIAFNPHEGTYWARLAAQEFQVSYTEMAEAARKAIEILVPRGIWVNVRYIPLCFMKGLERHVCNFMQWQYDPYEWECTSNSRMTSEQIDEALENAKRQKVFGTTPREKIHGVLMKKLVSANRFLPVCEDCANRPICDGIYPQYLKAFGTEEFAATPGNPIRDPIHYRLEDLSWARTRSPLEPEP